LKAFQNNKHIYRFLITIFYLLVAGYTFSQYTPRISNFSESIYKAHHQNWSVTPSNDGWVYFGNSDGLLVHNGIDWFKYPLPGNKIIRSVMAKDDRIYTGGYNEFGYWLKNECGEHTYHSLNHLIPDNALQGEEVWNIVSLGENIYLQSFAVVLVYNGATIKRIATPGAVMFMQVIDDKIWLPVIEYGIFELKSNTFELLPGTSIFKEEIITGMVSLKEKDRGYVIIGTSKHGIYFYENGKITPWQNPKNNFLKEYQINKIESLENGELLIGTIRSGLYILDKNFNTKYHLNGNNGLQNNTILSVFPDDNGNIWLGLDKGVTCLHYQDNVVMLKDRTGQLGAAYCVAYLNNKMYLGTNQGLYFYDSHIKNPEFELVKGTQGQVWQLLPLGNKLLCGHNEGTFLVSNNIARKISDVTGGWFTDKIKENQNLMIQGNYTGLAIFNLQNGELEFSHKVLGINDPIKKIVQLNDKAFWITGPNKGLKRVKLNDSYTKVIEIRDYSTRKEFGSSLNYDINLFQKKLRVFDGLNHFVYNEEKDSFFIDPFLQKEDSNFLFRNINDSLFLKLFNNEISFHKGSNQLFKERLTANKDYNTLFLDKNERLGVCTNDGFYIFDVANVNVSNQKSLIFHKAISIQDLTCFPLKGIKELKVPFDDKDLRIHLSSNNFYEDKVLEYRLLPDNKSWSSIPNNRFIDLYGLKSNKYSLEVTDGNTIQSINFLIGLPWYLTWWSWLIFICIFIFIGILLNNFLEKQLKFQAQKLKTENERIIREKMIQIENENLQKENIRKSKDLANVTNRLVEKNEVLMEIKNEIIEIRKSGDQKLTSRDYDLFMKQINENLTLQSDKKLFNLSFEDVHQGFLKKLKDEYPMLTGDDLQLAAYLRMNLSSKEIASLFNISVRGLENKRYRLRKKMNLNFETDLNEFFINYYKE
jgi:hypothetical protein